MKIFALLNELLNEATFSKGYNDPEKGFNNGKREITDAGKQGKQDGVFYDTDSNAVNKFRVSFYHMSRDDHGRSIPIDASDINKKYSKDFPTYRQADKYVRSPYVADMIKQYDKANRSDNPYHNELGSVLHDPYTRIYADIDQINLSDKGNEDRAEDINGELY